MGYKIEMAAAANASASSASPRKPKWDELGSPENWEPRSLQRPWGMPGIGLARDRQLTCTKVRIRSLHTKKPVLLEGLDGATMTVNDLKVLFRQTICSSSRKAITLRLYGKDLDPSDATLNSLFVPDNAELEAAFRKLSPSELDAALGPAKHVVMLDESKAPEPAEPVFPPPPFMTKDELPIATVLEVTPATTVANLKVMLKAPPECTIFFSAVYTSSFGKPLEDERTLESYHVLDGDVMFWTSGVGPSGAEEAAAPKKK